MRLALTKQRSHLVSLDFLFVALLVDLVCLEFPVETVFELPFILDDERNSWASW